jgi:hypothetical protein
MKFRVLSFIAVLFVFGLSAPQAGFCAIYEYVDKGGVIHFCDDLQAIPEQFRAEAKIVSGEDKEKEKECLISQSNQTAGSEVRTGVTAPGAGNSFGTRVLISAVVVVSAVFTFVILRILDSDHTKAAKIARVVILWGVSVYLLYAHAGDVVHMFRSIGGHVESVQQQSEEKGKKAAAVFKALDKLTEQAGQSPAPAEPEQEKKDH